MGDPKKQRKKFSKPNHPWQKERIAAEKEILKQYGLRRKYELWKMDSILKKLLHRAKTIIGERTLQSDVEKKQLLDMLYSIGLLKKDSKVEDVLNLTLKNVLDRRLQTLVYKKHIAKTMLQARQFITHEHIAVGNRKITSPSYLVSVEEEHHVKLTDTIKSSDNASNASEKKAEKVENSQ